MKDTNGMRLTLTRTACKVAAKSGWSPEQIQDAFSNPKAISASKTREGQFRVANKDICIVGVQIGKDEFRGITMFPGRSAQAPE